MMKDITKSNQKEPFKYEYLRRNHNDSKKKIVILCLVDLNIKLTC